MVSWNNHNNIIVLLAREIRKRTGRDAIAFSIFLFFIEATVVIETSSSEPSQEPVGDSCRVRGRAREPGGRPTRPDLSMARGD